MGINLLDLLNQIKKAVIQEQGSVFGLLMYFFLLMVMSDWIMKIATAFKRADGGPYIIAGLAAGAILIWLKSRRFPIKPDAINIAIANNEIINVSAKEFLTGEQKLQISSEVVNYFYARLSHLKHECGVGAYLNFFKLPPRIAVNYGNSDRLTSSIGVDMLMRGTIRSQGEVFFLNTKISVDKMITSYFFAKLIEHLNNYREIQFSFADAENKEFDKYLYEMTFISSIYYSFELINQQSYKSAEALLLQIIATLQKVYDDSSITSVMRGDDDFELIEILMYDSIARLYYDWSQDVLSNFDYDNQANTLLEKAASYMTQQLNLIKKHLKKAEFTTIGEELKLQAEYIYQLGELSKTGNTKLIHDYTDKLPTEVRQYSKTLGGFIATQFKDYEEAISYYQKAYDQDHHDLLSLRGLGIAYYHKGNYKQSYDYLHKLYQSTSKHLFFPMMYDDKIVGLLSSVSYRTGHYVDRVRYGIMSAYYHYQNTKVKKKYYTI